MCCMMCVFLLSTAGLGAVLALTYAGKVQLMPAAPRHTSHSNGGFKIDRLGDEKVEVQVSTANKASNNYNMLVVL